MKQWVRRGGDDASRGNVACGFVVWSCVLGMCFCMAWFTKSGHDATNCMQQLQSFLLPRTHRHTNLYTIAHTQAQHARNRDTMLPSSSSTSSPASISNQPSLTSPLRWGILGCGDVCEHKSGPAFYKASNAELVAVMRRDAAKVQDFAKRHHVPRFYTDASQLLADEGVDAVYIATPPGSHKELALLCVQAGKPCLVEKPMARSAVECQEISEAFHQAGLPLFVAFYRRHLPKFEAAKQVLEEGKLGQITEVRLCCTRPAPAAGGTGDNWRVDAKVAGGGLFLDLGSHMLDLLDFFFGPLEEVQGLAARLEEAGEAREAAKSSATDVENQVRMVFKTASGALGSGSWNFASSLSEDYIHIIGTGGHMKFSVFNNDPISLTMLRRQKEEGEEKEEHVKLGGFESSNPAHVHLPLVEAATQDLLLDRFKRWQIKQQKQEEEAENKEEEGADATDVTSSIKQAHDDEWHCQCRSTGDSAMRTSKVMDIVLKSFYGGSRDDAFWERPETWGIWGGSS